MQRKGMRKAKTKTTTRRKATGRKTAAKRERMSPRGDTRFVRRDERGRIKESDDAGRSLAADRRTRAKTTVKAGQDDKGDQKRRKPAKSAGARRTSTTGRGA